MEKRFKLQVITQERFNIRSELFFKEQKPIRAFLETIFKA